MAQKAAGTTGGKLTLKPRTTYTVVIPGIGTYRVNTGPSDRVTVTSAIAVAITALTGKVAYIPVWNEIRLEGTTITAKPEVRLQAPQLLPGR